MRDSDVDLYGFGRLEAEFGEPAEAGPGETPGSDGGPVDGGGLIRTERDVVGVEYRRMLAEMTRIIAYQWDNHIERSALKGFLLHGGVGLGKTTLARRLTLELCHRFDQAGARSGRHDEVVMILADAANLARGMYGDTEEQLKQLFDLARNGGSRRLHHHDGGAPHSHGDDPVRRTVLLFDDVESLFMHRASNNAKEWHFSQNSVFFHQIDGLDTGHIAVVLTTNRIDLLDEAVADRFLPYAFDVPPAEVLVSIAHAKARAQNLEAAQVRPVLDAIGRGEIHSVRQLERAVMRVYVEAVVGDRSPVPGSRITMAEPGPRGIVSVT